MMSDLHRAIDRLLPQGELARLRPSLATHDLRPGDRVVLVMDNTTLHAGLLLMLVSERITPLLLAPESTAAERDAQRQAIGGRHVLEWSATQGLLATGAAPERQTSLAFSPAPEDGILLLTSGSTGRPALVQRTLKSWQDEARRYGTLLGLVPEHRLLLAAPLWHAYSLGWLWAAALSGCELEVFRPTELAGMAEAMRNRATHCALTPGIALLLARRTAPSPRPPQLEVVMAGAGPVDGDLEERFTAAFGLGLSRNYGSTESGALCAGLAPLPPLVIGWLMPHLRLVDAPEAGSQKPFPLSVALEDGRTHGTGDLAVCSADGLLTLVGRESTAIRRGERWISPFEIESVIRSHPSVHDCSVRAVRSHHAGHDHIFASVVTKDGKAFDAGALRDFCGQYLSRSKVPDRFEQVPDLRRNDLGKTPAPKAYRAAPTASLLEAAAAYKRSNLLFALLETGVLESLDGRKTSDQIAHEHGLHADTLARTLELAQWLGLIEEADSVAKGRSSDPIVPRTHDPVTESVRDISLLERRLSQTLNSEAGLAVTLRQGHLACRERVAREEGELASLYQRAMNGAHKQLSMSLIWRELARRQAAGPVRVLDISATDGGYTRWLRDRGQLALEGSRRMPVGALVGDSASRGQDAAAWLCPADVQACSLRFDVVVFDNALHHPEVAHLLPRLLELLADDGHVLVDEIFIEPGLAAAGVDWLTHGGLCFPTEAALLRQLSSLGFEPVAQRHTSTAVLHHTFLLKAKGRTP